MSCVVLSFHSSYSCKNLLKLNPRNQYSGSSGAVAVSKKALFKGTDCDRCVILKFIMDIAIGSPLSRSPHSAESETLGRAPPDCSPRSGRLRAHSHSRERR